MTITALATLSGWLNIGSVIVAEVSGIFLYRGLPLALRYIALVAGFDMVMELSMVFIIKILH